MSKGWNATETTCNIWQLYLIVTSVPPLLRLLLEELPLLLLLLEEEEEEEDEGEEGGLPPFREAVMPRVPELP